MSYLRGIKILIFSIITFFAFLSFHSSSIAQVNLPVQCEGSSCEVNDSCGQYDKGSILYLDCQEANVPKPPKSPIDPCANGRCRNDPSRVPAVQPGDACSWYWNDDVSCQQFWCSGEFNGNCEGRPREAIEVCNKLRIQGCAVCEYQGNTAICRPVEQEVPTPTGCYIPLVGNACVVSVDPKECPSGCSSGQTCYRGHEGAACFPTIQQGKTAVPGVVNCGGGYCNTAGGGNCVTDHQERQFCQYSDADAKRSTAGAELPEPATKTVYHNCGGSALGAIDCQSDERCWMNRETGVPSCHPKDEKTALVTSLTCPDFDPKTHYCDRDGKLKKYPTPIGGGIQPTSNYTVPGVYDPATGEMSPEADTSQICTYSQQDTSGGPVACGIGLLKDGSCQYDSRVFKPIDCKNTEICYVKEGNSCKVGLKNGSDCDTSNLGQPIDCGLADIIGSSASGGACIYKDSKYSCEIKASPPPDTVTCVYSQEAAKGHENSTDPNDPLRKGCFVGKCAPGSPCTQGSFNVEGCAYADGLGQPVTCPVVGGTGGAGGGGGGTGSGGTSSEIEKIIIYGKRNGPAGTRQLEYAGTRKELTTSEYQKLKQQGFVDTPFQLSGVDGLQNEDEILFCAEFHPKNGTPFTKCTDAFTYYD